MTAFKMPDCVLGVSYSMPSQDGLFIDAHTADQGYVTVGCVGDGGGYERLKFQVRNGSQAYNYDLVPKDRPMSCPINMGNGDYLFRIMERVEGNSYAQVMSVARLVKLANRFSPYLVPTVFCNYAVDGKCVKTARHVVENCKTELRVLDVTTDWVANYLSYDYSKATRLSGGTGYVPNPDATFAAHSGVCFDYASMEAAMLRSVGIPCRVVTGYVNGTTYHAWVCAYVNGRWRRRDPTFLSVLAVKSGDVVLKGYSYRNRFIY